MSRREPGTVPFDRFRQEGERRSGNGHKGFNPKPQIVEGKKTSGLSNVDARHYIETAEHLSYRAKWIGVLLIEHRNSARLQCNPGYDTLVRESGFASKESVSRAIRELEDANELIVLRRKGKQGKLNNYYFFAWDFEKALELFYNQKSALSKVSDDENSPFCKARDIYKEEFV